MVQIFPGYWDDARRYEVSRYGDQDKLRHTVLAICLSNEPGHYGRSFFEAYGGHPMWHSTEYMLWFPAGLPKWVTWWQWFTGWYWWYQWHRNCFAASAAEVKDIIDLGEIDEIVVFGAEVTAVEEQSLSVLDYARQYQVPVLNRTVRGSRAYLVVRRLKQTHVQLVVSNSRGC